MKTYSIFKNKANTDSFWRAVDRDDKEKIRSLTYEDPMAFFKAYGEIEHRNEIPEEMIKAACVAIFKLKGKANGKDDLSETIYNF